MYIDIEPIVDSLDDKKWEFIAQCRRDIEAEVASRGRRCLSIREVGVRVHAPALDNYMKVLWKFYRRETYHGHQLESVLADPISELVANNYSQFLEDNKPDIEAQLKKAVIEHLDISSALEEILHDELKKRGIKHIQHEAADAFVSACSIAIHSQVMTTASTTISSAVTNSVGTAVGASIAHALAVALHHAIAAAIVHVAHSAAIKIVLKTAIAHCVGAIVTAVVVKMVATHMATASVGAFLGPLAWGIGGSIVFYKIMTIPETLGEKLGDALAANLGGDFRDWTEKAVQSYVDQLQDPEKLLEEVIKSEMDNFLPDIVTEVVGDVPKYAPYDDLEKESKKVVGYAGKGVKKVAKKRWGWWN